MAEGTIPEINIVALAFNLLATGLFNLDGLQGPQGQNGAQGVDGRDGPQGQNGAQGVGGRDGPQGQNGAQGVDGRDGPQGQNGAQGVDGRDGPQGSDGIAGVQGGQGLMGYQGMTGPQGLFGGPQGFQGLTGLQGPQGFDGAQGLEGAQGLMGQTGSVGPQGAFGGPQGSQGSDGTQGSPGLNGAQGRPGIAGVNAFTFTTLAFTQPVVGNTVDLAVVNATWAAIGQVTYVSNAGYYNVVSIPGPTTLRLQNLGYPGNVPAGTAVGGPERISPAGIQGSQGNNGTQGNQGLEGTQGVMGLQGFMGMQGNTGPQGNQGLEGTQGVMGLQGNTGPQGAFGGPPGVQGPQGATGPQGGSGIYPANTRFVSPLWTPAIAPGDPFHFGNIQSAIDSITNASATNPYVILVYPGIYDGTTALAWSDPRANPFAHLRQRRDTAMPATTCRMSDNHVDTSFNAPLHEHDARQGAMVGTLVLKPFITIRGFGYPGAVIAQDIIYTPTVNFGTATLSDITVAGTATLPVQVTYALPSVAPVGTDNVLTFDNVYANNVQFNLLGNLPPSAAKNDTVRMHDSQFVSCILHMTGTITVESLETHWTHMYSSALASPALLLDQGALFEMQGGSFGFSPSPVGALAPTVSLAAAALWRANSVKIFENTATSITLTTNAQVIFDHCSINTPSTQWDLTQGTWNATDTAITAVRFAFNAGANVTFHNCRVASSIMVLTQCTFTTHHTTIDLAGNYVQQDAVTATLNDTRLSVGVDMFVRASGTTFVLRTGSINVGRAMFLGGVVNFPTSVSFLNADVQVANAMTVGSTTVVQPVQLSVVNVNMTAQSVTMGWAVTAEFDACHVGVVTSWLLQGLATNDKPMILSMRSTQASMGTSFNLQNGIIANLQSSTVSAATMTCNGGSDLDATLRPSIRSEHVTLTVTQTLTVQWFPSIWRHCTIDAVNANYLANTVFTPYMHEFSNCTLVHASLRFQAGQTAIMSNGTIYIENTMRVEDTAKLTWRGMDASTGTACTITVGGSTNPASVGWSCYNCNLSAMTNATLTAQSTTINWRASPAIFSSLTWLGLCTWYVSDASVRWLAGGCNFGNGTTTANIAGYFSDVDTYYNLGASSATTMTLKTAGATASIDRNMQVLTRANAVDGVAISFQNTLGVVPYVTAPTVTTTVIAPLTYPQNVAIQVSPPPAPPVMAIVTTPVVAKATATPTDITPTIASDVGVATLQFVVTLNPVNVLP